MYSDADLVGMTALLTLNPLLTVLAKGTVTTSSDNSYEDVTAIQLAYLMDDVGVCNTMLPYIRKLPPGMIEKAFEQLTQKMQEVEMQQDKFKPYDFSLIIQALKAVQGPYWTNLSVFDAALQDHLMQVKKDFEPTVIKQGKSFIKEHLLEGFKIFIQQNWDDDSWTHNKMYWYLVKIIAIVLNRVEKCCEKEFSQGLASIVNKKEPLNRDAKVRNSISGDKEIPYRGTIIPGNSSHYVKDAKLIFGEHYYMNIYSGCASTMGPSYAVEKAIVTAMEELSQTKKLGMEQFRQELQKLIPKVVANQLSQRC